jgi:hypothetical protein
LIASLLVPVIIPAGFFFPYVAPRNIFFRIVVELGALALVWALCFGDEELDLRYEPIFWALVAFVSATLLSDGRRLGVAASRAILSSPAHAS